MGKGRESRKERRKLERALVKQQRREAQNRSKGSYWKLWIGGAVLSVALTVGGIVYSVFDRKVEDNYYSKSVLEEKIENNEITEKPTTKIGFEQFKANLDNEAYVQRYLDRLLEKEAKQTKTWQGLERIVYKPQFSEEEEKVKTYGDIEEGKQLQALAYTKGKKGERSKCFISKRLLRHARSEDELKSMIDNESFHAYATLILRLPFTIKETGDESKDVVLLALETMSFDYQFQLIDKGKRKVRHEFATKFGKEYHNVYNNLKRISKVDSIDGRYAKAILDNLRIKINVDGAVKIPDSIEKKVRYDAAVSEISFEQVKANLDNIDFVQRYLDQLLEKEAKETPDWEGIERFVYKPYFRKERETTDTYGKIDLSKFKALAYTNCKRNEKGVCYVSKRFFKFSKSEDEVKSLLDNEAFQACCFWKNILPYKINLNVNADEKTWGIAFEAMSFDYQHSLIHDKKRKVSKDFVLSNAKTYYEVWKNLEEIAEKEKDNDEGRFVREVLNSLRMKFKKELKRY
ncbi:hypothetical protein KY342_02895 [Candidatus Woesearchaeota archaeon]|nr:hypothetical protein [Candidatus Woesearchaeota archaeon]